MKNKKEFIPKAVRTAVWNKYIGSEKGISKCYVRCGEQISQSNFECGHVISERDGGLVNVENLRPICANCNRSMGTKNMMEFMKQYKLNNDENSSKYIKEFIFNKKQDDLRIKLLEEKLKISEEKLKISENEKLELKINYENQIDELKKESDHQKQLIKLIFKIN